MHSQAGKGSLPSTHILAYISCHSPACRAAASGWRCCCRRWAERQPGACASLRTPGQQRSLSRPQVHRAIGLEVHHVDSMCEALRGGSGKEAGGQAACRRRKTSSQFC